MNTNLIIQFGAAGVVDADGHARVRVDEGAGSLRHLMATPQGFSDLAGDAQLR